MQTWLGVGDASAAAAKMHNDGVPEDETLPYVLVYLDGESPEGYVLEVEGTGTVDTYSESGRVIAELTEEVPAGQQGKTGDKLKAAARGFKDDLGGILDELETYVLGSVAGALRFSRVALHGPFRVKEDWEEDAAGHLHIARLQFDF